MPHGSVFVLAGGAGNSRVGGLGRVVGSDTSRTAILSQSVRVQNSILSPEFAYVIVSGEMLAALEAFLYGTVWHFVSNTWFYRVLFRTRPPA